MRFFRSSLTVLLPGAVALFATPLWADDIHQEVKAGLPQLDVSFFPGQIFWLVVTFTVLYVLMSRIALPGVQRVLDKRQATIAADLKAAADANEAAKNAIAEIEKILANAKTQAIENEDMSPAAQRALDLQAEQHKELERGVHQAEIRIGVARDAALHEVRTASAELAAAIFETITGTKLQAKS